MKLRVQLVATSIAVVSLHHHLGCGSCAVQSVIEVGTCKELQQAVALTVSSGDISAALAPGGVSCDEWTTFEIENNELSLVAQEGGSQGKHHVYALENVRFLVSSGTLHADLALYFTTGADNKTQDMNGGVLNVAEGAYARFASAVVMKGVAIESVSPAGLNVTSEKRFGGCIYNQGSVLFAEYLQASGCATVGGGGSIPGDGGGIFNGKTGDIVFEGRVKMSDCETTAPPEVLCDFEFDEDPYMDEMHEPAVLDSSEVDTVSCQDETHVAMQNKRGGRGGAIFNEGKMWMFKKAKFFDNVSAAGGAIFNEGDIRFVKKQAMFVKNRSYGYGDCDSGKDGRDFSGGQVLNTGLMTFDGGVVFEDGRTNGYGGAIGNYGSVTMKTSALFKRNSAGCMGGAISSPSKATFELPQDTRFQANTVAYDEVNCENWFERDALGYVPKVTREIKYGNTSTIITSSEVSYRCLRDMFGMFG